MSVIFLNNGYLTYPSCIALLTCVSYAVQCANIVTRITLNEKMWSKSKQSENEGVCVCVCAARAGLSDGTPEGLIGGY